MHCAACNEPIGNEAKVSSGDQAFHSRCFKCCECERPLAGVSYFTVAAGKVCGECHDKNHDSKCGACQRSLNGVSFYTVENKKICADCYASKFASKCEACKESIVGEKTTASGKEYHPKCFTCHKCDKPIGACSFGNDSEGFFHSPNCQAAESGSNECAKCDRGLTGVKFFTQDNGDRVCGYCVKCKVCNEPILEGQINMVRDWKFHEGCFKCPNCSKALSGRKIKLDSHENVVCSNCSE